MLLFIHGAVNEDYYFGKSNNNEKTENSNIGYWNVCVQIEETEEMCKANIESLRTV